MEPVTVIGAGLMGTAIAYVFSSAGHPVSVHDPDPKALARVAAECARIAGACGHDGAAPADVRTVGDLPTAVSDAALVVEAAVEDLEVKQGIFRAVSAHAHAEAILASNTSAIPVRELARVVRCPERVVGTHFWNPPYAVPLVEVVQAPQTDLRVVERVMNLLARVGQRPVHVRRDVPGFVGNRLQHALKREAIALVAEGVCDAETVDTVTKLGFGSRLAVLGPLEQSDLVGLDLTLAIHRTVMPALDPASEPHPYLVDLVARGELGMRTGKGFRSWTPEEASRVRARLEEHLLRGREVRDSTRRP
ncbi:3-hydroxyacyl-CoA dehydrogenase family protein [Streptomyces sp. NPDC090493]|uniref:3-hydroxyacyl-CoA dehydrogenase family protein n=1 Tax=Streptomyces sp. NPDC090493 TaxID=3365964 RepID=UPI00380B74E6